MGNRKFEFAGPAWFAELRRLLDDYTAQAGPNITLSLCEVFTGVPHHLDKHGNGKLFWYCRIANGRAEFHEGEIDDADVKTVAEYSFVRAVAKMRIDPVDMTAYQARLDDGERAGKIVRSGRGRAKIPATFFGMHNDLAELTE